MEAKTAIRCGMCGDTKLQNGEPCPQCTLGLCDNPPNQHHDIPHARYISCDNWIAQPVAPDTAKEQAGRKMFEALGRTLHVIAGLQRNVESYYSRTYGESPSKTYWQDIDEFKTNLKAVLNAGREAGWGQ